MLRGFCISVLFAVLSATMALASPFDGMSVEEIRAHPDFVADDYSLSQAENSAEPDGRKIYWWIGYIPSGDQRIYFTSYGEALTCVKWEETGEWVPQWVADTLNELLEEGIIKMAR